MVTSSRHQIPSSLCSIFSSRHQLCVVKKPSSIRTITKQHRFKHTNTQEVVHFRLSKAVVYPVLLHHNHFVQDYYFKNHIRLTARARVYFAFVIAHEPQTIQSPSPSSFYKGKKGSFFCDTTCPTLEHTKRYPQHPGGFCTNGNSFFTSILSPQGCKLLHLTICNGHPFLLSAKREKKSRGSGGKGETHHSTAPILRVQGTDLDKPPSSFSPPTQHTEKEFRDPK